MDRQFMHRRHNNNHPNLDRSATVGPPPPSRLTWPEGLRLIERAKQEWEVTADSLPQFVALVNERGHLRRVNRTVEQWGLGRVTQVAGLELHELFHPHCSDADCYLRRFWQQAWPSVVEGQTAECEADDACLQRYLHFQIRPILGLAPATDLAAGSAGVVVVQDITARKQAEASLQLAYGELEQRIAERTAELVGAVAALKQEISERQQAEIEKIRLFEELQHGREQMRQLAQQTVSAQEEERARLSRELHDEAGQLLTALKLRLDLMRRDFGVEAEGMSQQLVEAVDLADTIMARLHTLARDLRPPALDTAGLDPVLAGLCRDFAGWSKLTVHYQGLDLPELTASAKICLYRFLQEALTNVAKHAQASQVSVRLEAIDSQVLLSIEDDGRGFDQAVEVAGVPSSRSIGLLGLRERLELLGGWLELETGPGYGTRLTAHLPREANQ